MKIKLAPWQIEILRKLGDKPITLNARRKMGKWQAYKMYKEWKKSKEDNKNE